MLLKLFARRIACCKISASNRRKRPCRQGRYLWPAEFAKGDYWLSVRTARQVDHGQEVRRRNQATCSVQSRSEKCRAADPWDEIAKAIKTQQIIFPNLTYLERLRGFSGRLAQYARVLVRAAEEKPKPNQDACANSGIPAWPRWSNSCFRLSRSTRLSKRRYSPIPLEKCRKHWAKTIPT